MIAGSIWSDEQAAYLAIRREDNKSGWERRTCLFDTAARFSRNVTVRSYFIDFEVGEDSDGIFWLEFFNKDSGGMEHLLRALARSFEESGGIIIEKVVNGKREETK